MTPILNIQRVTKIFMQKLRIGWRKQKRWFTALHEVNLTVHQGEIIGIVGESGSGKTTLGKILVHLLTPTSGQVYFKGQEITRLTYREFHPYRQHIQMVFQNPYASLNPGMNIYHHLSEVVQLRRDKTEQTLNQKITHLLEQVQLSPTILRQFPNQISGGERRRIALARVLALRPEVLILDEPVASLDTSIKGELIALLLRLQERYQLTYLWISHDISVIQHVADRIVVMFSGEILEIFPVGEKSVEDYQHPYTEVLLQTAHAIQNAFVTLQTNFDFLFNVSADSIQASCPYLPFCQRYLHAGKPSICRMVHPELKAVANRHYVRCHFPWKEKIQVESYA